MLLAGAGLFVTSLRRAERVDLGIEPACVIAASVAWPSVETDADPDREAARRQVFLDQALERLRRDPAIEEASLAIGVPFNNSYGVSLRVPGVDSIPDLPGGGPYISAVDHRYFATMGLTVLRGRGFTEADRAGSEPVAVVGARMARTLWLGQEPLDKCLIIFADTLPCARVVGVVEDGALWRLRDQPSLQYYVPLGQERQISGRLLLVRPRDEDGDRGVALVRRRLRELRADLPYVRATVLADALEPEMRPWRLGASLFTVFGGLAALVATVGLYGVIGYLVEQRTHELGVRLALGATAGRALRYVLRRGLLPVAGGLAAGLVGALVAGRWVEPLLFETSARDGRVFGAVALLVACVSVAAALVPAWRATRVNPVAAMRAD